MEKVCLERQREINIIYRRTSVSSEVLHFVQYDKGCTVNHKKITILIHSYIHTISFLNDGDCSYPRAFRTHHIHKLTSLLYNNPRCSISHIHTVWNTLLIQQSGQRLANDSDIQLSHLFHFLPHFRRFTVTHRCYSNQQHWQCHVWTSRKEDRDGAAFHTW